MLGLQEEKVNLRTRNINDGTWPCEGAILDHFLKVQFLGVFFQVKHSVVPLAGELWIFPLSDNEVSSPAGYKLLAIKLDF